jgi:uncharacterized OB-fold protein
MGIEAATLKSRPITLIYNIPINNTLTFWEGLKEGKIYTTKCKRCNKAIFPPVADCPHCLSTEMEWFELKGEAEIEAFTHIVVRPLSFQQEKPYTIVIGRMKEGVRVLARLAEVKISDLRMGMKVKLVVRASANNEPTFMFVPLG